MHLNLDVGAEEKRAASVTAQSEWELEGGEGAQLTLAVVTFTDVESDGGGHERVASAHRFALWQNELVAECDVHLPQFIPEWVGGIIQNSDRLTVFLPPHCPKASSNTVMSFLMTVDAAR